ncbi:glycosyl hydrolase family 25 [Prevotella sp. HMSC069G02]|nr:glycosyl hydrolase family 25 [Prevotella sp. HMSC069G02]
MSIDKKLNYGIVKRGSTIYQGYVIDGMRQGNGKMRDSIGNIYEGTWRNDTLISGTCTDSIGNRYIGFFNQDAQLQGYGVYQSKDGTYYEGNWINGKRDGFGVAITANNELKVGEWHHGHFHGERLNYTNNRIYGIDISKYQHVIGKKHYGIKWHQLRIVGLGKISKKKVTGRIDYPISFIYLKSTEGKSLQNPYYKKDYRDAKAAGFKVGSYHFFTTKTPAAQQAHNFLKNSSVKKGDFPPVLDVEPLPSQIHRMGGTKALFNAVRTWLRIVEKVTGRRPILYISQIFVNRYLPEAPDLKAKYRVWIARYGEYKPDVKLVYWQLSPDGRVKGIHGLVDINVFNGYQNEFDKFCNELR